MEYLFIYLLQVADVIYYAARILFTVFGISTIILLVLYTSEYFYDNDKRNKKNFYLLKINFLFVILSVLLFCVPTKQTILLIGGTYLGKKAINTVITNEKIKKIDTIINLQLDKYIKELQDTQGN